MNLTHTEECLQAKAEVERRQEAWRKRWPNHCEDCNGVQEYPCPTCLTRGICPRCGGEEGVDVSGDYAFCRSCGYREDAEIDHRDHPDYCCLPDGYTCNCRVQEVEVKRKAIEWYQLQRHNAALRIEELEAEIARLMQ